MKITLNNQDVYCYTNSRDIDSDKPSIVFIHGSGMDHTVWTLAARHFARHGNNVIAVDLPGHGRSTGAPLESIPAMADWLVGVLDALNIKTSAVVGHSLGSLIALDFSARQGKSSVSTEDRTRMLRLIENMTLGRNAVTK